MPLIVSGQLSGAGFSILKSFGIIHIMKSILIAVFALFSWTTLANADDEVYIVPFAADRLTIISPERYGRRINRVPQSDQEPKSALPWKKKGDVWVYTPVMWDGAREAGYPSVACPMAFMVFSDGSRSVCVSVEDQVVRAAQPFVEYNPSSGKVSVWWQTLETGGAPCRIRAQVHNVSGDWHSAVRGYGRRQVARHPMVSHPQYLVDASAVLLVILKQQNGEVIWPYSEFDRLADICDRLGVDYVGLFGWTRDGHDNFYPDYVPDPAQGGRTELVKGIELLRRRGIRTFLYANGQLQERGKTDYWKRCGRYAAQLRADGTQYGETWHKYLDSEPHHFDLGCLSDLSWKNRMRGLAWQAHALGSDGILYDQLGVGEPRPCFAENHGHVRGAVVYAEERVRFLRDIADEMRLVNADFIVLTEGFHDTVLNSCAAFHGWGSCLSLAAASSFATRGRGMSDWMPEIAKTAYPALQSTMRVPTPILTRTIVNYAALFGFKHELEVRYAPDRAYLECGIRPQTSDYGTIREKPNLTTMHRTDPVKAAAYLRRVCDFQRRHRDFLLRGMFRDGEGVVLGGETESVGAVRWQAGDGRSGVLIWNASCEPRQVSVAVDGVAWKTAAAPIAADSLRFVTEDGLDEP